jgi:hypothetical protein
MTAWRRFWVGILAGSLALAAHAVELNFAALDGLAPEEQHRQLSLMLLVSAGADESLLLALGPFAEADAEPDGTASPAFDPETYTSPLARIVDQASLLAGAQTLFRFTIENRGTIRARLDELESRPDVLSDAAAMAKITEDTILIRQAIANSMGAVELDPAGQEAANRYRANTVVLRNTLEYAEFKAELDRLTDNAIASVGGKLDAYQRMFDVETNTGVLDRRIRSAELIYLPEGQFDPRAGELTEEMLRNMVLMESQPNR